MKASVIVVEAAVVEVEQTVQSSSDELHPVPMQHLRQVLRR